MTVMLQTLGDMVTEFGRRVGEPNENNSKWDGAIRARWINEGQLDVVEETRCLEKEWDTAVSAWVSAGDEKVSLPANIFDDSTIEVYWIDSDDKEHKLTEKHPRFSSTQNDETTGTPSHFFRIGRVIHLMPLPDADGTVRWRGECMPDEMTARTDQTLIPASYRILPVLWAVMTALTEDGEYAEADRIRAYEYEPRLLRLRKLSRERRSKRGEKFHFPAYL